MKKLGLLLSLLVSSIAVAQDEPFQQTEIITSFSRPVFVQRAAASSEILNIQTLGDRWGIAHTAGMIFKTTDGGATWNKLDPRIASYENLSAVKFSDHLNGYAVVSSSTSYRLALLRTEDGGLSWERSQIVIDDLRVHEAEIHNGELEAGPNGELTLSFRVTTSSNFSGEVRYSSDDGGASWRFITKNVEPRSSDVAEPKRSGAWSIRTDGSCSGSKSACVQETRVFANGVDITPPEIVELSRIEKEKAIANAVPMFAAPPGGSTRVSLNRGFDKCTAASVSQMQTWWDNSPHYDSNIYMSGRNRGCSQPLLNAAWVDQVSAMGWGFIPTIVGYQSPCSVCTSCAKHSSDTATAETQGRGEADIAVADANALGLTAGTVLYYDMERYDETAQTPNCRVSTASFLKGWTDRLHELGYVSGTYGSPFNANPDWVNLPGTSRMDAIWMARWDNVMSVWTYVSFPTFPTNVWNNHQRIKQWQAPHNETWGGVTFNIDGNILDGPVAGLAVAKNRRADFDGDRKSDISVFRPDTGVWYIQKSNGSGYIILTFGFGTDIVTPGDFDGDGKTDQAVYRPSDGTWHMLTKGYLYTARPFGLSGDIPTAADYNGDGKTDIAVFRPSTGVWYISNSDSLGTYTIMQFGLEGDRPVIGDYDGDGKADIAVWRPSTGVWYVARSSDQGYTVVQFGISTDQPAQGDYDGDGKTDFAVYRNGTWYLWQTTAGITQFNFGLPGDLPASGDFDGDGRDDTGVYRPSSGIWYILQSTNGFYAQQFGLSSDRPIPSAYLPQ